MKRSEMFDALARVEENLWAEHARCVVARSRATGNDWYDADAIVQYAREDLCEFLSAMRRGDAEELIEFLYNTYPAVLQGSGLEKLNFYANHKPKAFKLTVGMKAIKLAAIRGRLREEADALEVGVATMLGVA